MGGEESDAGAEQENQVMRQDQAGDDDIGKVMVVLAKIAHSGEVNRVGVSVFKLADAFSSFLINSLAARAGSAGEAAAATANTNIEVGVHPTLITVRLLP